MYKEKIDAYIDAHKDAMIEDLCSLVRINSQRGEASEGKPYGEGPAQAVAAAEALMQKYGFKTTNYDNYVVAGDFSDQEKKLDILAHLDVVPVTDEWTMTAPFEPKIIDGKIYGRGTADDKGPAIAALYAMRAIKELGIPMKHSVRLILGSDEECGSSDLVYYYNKEKEAPFSFTPDADFPLINIEKGRMANGISASFKDGLKVPGVSSFRSGDKVNVVPQKAWMTVVGLTEAQIKEAADALTEEIGVAFIVTEKEPADGNAVYEIEAKGKAAHASTPQEGKNALTAMLRLITKLPLADSEGLMALKALDKLFPYEDTCGKALGVYREEPQSGAVTVCFSVINYTAEGFKAEFDARLPIGCDNANTREPIAASLAANGMQIDDAPMSEPHCVPGDSPFVKTLLGSYERYFGVKGEPIATGGGTYVHHLERGVAFGCMVEGVDNHMHGDDEFMVLDTFFDSAKIFADAILKVCNEL